MTCRQIFSSPGPRTIYHSIKELPHQNQSAYFLRFFRVIWSALVGLMDAHHYCGRPVFPDVPIMIAPPTHHDPDQPFPRWRRLGSDSEKPRWCKNDRTQPDSTLQLSIWSSPTHTLWEKYAESKTNLAQQSPPLVNWFIMEILLGVETFTSKHLNNSSVRVASSAILGPLMSVSLWLANIYRFNFFLDSHFGTLTHRFSLSPCNIFAVPPKQCKHCQRYYGPRRYLL